MVGVWLDWMILDVFFNLCDSMTLKNSIVFMVYENPEIKVNILKTKILRNLERLGYDKKKICLLSVVSVVFLKGSEKKGVRQPVFQKTIR